MRPPRHPSAPGLLGFCPSTPARRSRGQLRGGFPNSAPGDDTWAGAGRGPLLFHPRQRPVRWGRFRGALATLAQPLRSKPGPTARLPADPAPPEHRGGAQSLPAGVAGATPGRGAGQGEPRPQPPPPGTPGYLRTENPGPTWIARGAGIASLISPVSSFPADPFDFPQSQIFLLCRLPLLGFLPTILPSLTATSQGARLGNLFWHFLTDALTQTFNFLGSVFVSVQWRCSHYPQVAMRMTCGNEGKIPSLVPGAAQVPLKWS